MSYKSLISFYDEDMTVTKLRVYLQKLEEKGYGDRKVEIDVGRECESLTDLYVIDDDSDLTLSDAGFIGDFIKQKS